ncbi:MAG: glycosyltransferase [Nostocaceae cyanobacterium]|nr:glycosyltransferase [Nostocaceae cyanobacterium]
MISVILPVYNGAATIRETITSVFSQTFSDLELIVINDGSQDSTLDIINSFSDARLKLFSYPNAGQAASRNRGVSHAVGEYISFIDADDLWKPEKLANQLKALQENPQAAVAYSWTDHIDDKSQFLRVGCRMTVQGNVYPELLIGNFIENGSNPLIRKQIFNEVGGFEISLNPAEDWDLWLRLAANYQYVVVKSPDILYRVSTNSMSSSSYIHKMEASSLRVIERAFTQAPNSLQYLNKYTIANLYKYLSYKSLEAIPGKQNSFQAARCLLKAVKTDSSLLSKPVVYKAWLKLALMTFLDPQQATELLTKYSRLSNTSTFLGYIKIYR